MNLLWYENELLENRVNPILPRGEHITITGMAMPLHHYGTFFCPRHVIKVIFGVFIACKEPYLQVWSIMNALFFHVFGEP